MPSLTLGLLVVASFLLGLRVGLAVGCRAERRRILQQLRARALVR